MDSIRKVELEAFISGELQDKIKACLNLIFSVGLSVLHVQEYITPSTFYNASIVFSAIEPEEKVAIEMCLNDDCNDCFKNGNNLK